MRYIYVVILIAFFSYGRASHIEKIISTVPLEGAFPIFSNQSGLVIYVDSEDFIGVRRAVSDLQSDLEKVTGFSIPIGQDLQAYPIIIGTIGRSRMVDRLVAERKINAGDIAGRWESALIAVVDNPIEGVEKALVIAGSDKRGTIFGIYELSSQAGVSPWHYWADVPPKYSPALYVKSGRFHLNSPAVKYRGIFLNDEAPALTGWARATFGGFNHQFYEKVFELILRLRGNFLWPAMWGSAFNDDDSLNPVVADEYGVVISTSHHEPMTRAHDEWRRYGSGEWDYQKNADTLRDFWRTGLDRVKDREVVVTLGMRGDGDEPMTRGTAISLLEQIVSDQREIIGKVTGRPAEQTPQVWALYKEVQEYYDQGMRVPDDVTLLLCDDNWGNLRKLPPLKERKRKGGYGIYYHFDYVGGPRNYKWINTNPIQKIWEQMSLAYEYGANEIWVVNVGDLKPMEFPISFFLDLAWNPDAIGPEALSTYTEGWAKQQFGETYHAEIATLIDRYGFLAGRVKPELLTADTYSLVNYNEWKGVVDEYEQLLGRALYIKSVIDNELQDAYYQLVLHPIEALCNLHQLYAAHAKNRLYAKQGRNTTNYFADEVERLFARDAEITDYYNNQLNGGKWRHMMDQVHIGYTSWQQPESNIIPVTDRVDILREGQIGISGDGLLFDKGGQTTQYIELFNKGSMPAAYHIAAPTYLRVSETAGSITHEKVIRLDVEWDSMPETGIINAELLVTGSGTDTIFLPVRIDNRSLPIRHRHYFVESGGYISIEAPDYTRAEHDAPFFWKTINNYGRTKGGVTLLPRAIEDWGLEAETPRLQYDVLVRDSGTFLLNCYLSPSLDFRDAGGLRFAVSTNDGQPVIVNMDNAEVDTRAWGRSVAESIRIAAASLEFKQGMNTISFWPISPGVVLQKLIVDTGGLKPSFLGPPASLWQLKPSE